LYLHCLEYRKLAKLIRPIAKSHVPQLPSIRVNHISYLQLTGNCKEPASEQRTTCHSSSCHLHRSTFPSSSDFHTAPGCHVILAVICAETTSGISFPYHIAVTSHSLRVTYAVHRPSSKYMPARQRSSSSKKFQTFSAQGTVIKPLQKSLRPKAIDRRRAENEARFRQYKIGGFKVTITVITC